MDYTEQAAQYFTQGYHCSQVIMLLAEDLRGRHNEELVCALGGLGGGMATGKTCGTLTGGACVLASYAAQLGGTPAGNDNSYKPLVSQYVQWFAETFGSTDCCDIVEAEREKRIAYCPGLIAKSFDACVRLLEQAGVEQ